MLVDDANIYILKVYNNATKIKKTHEGPNELSQRALMKKYTRHKEENTLIDIFDLLTNNVKNRKNKEAIK